MFDDRDSGIVNEIVNIRFLTENGKQKTENGL